MPAPAECTFRKKVLYTVGAHEICSGISGIRLALIGLLVETDVVDLSEILSSLKLNQCYLNTVMVSRDLDQFT